MMPFISPEFHASGGVQEADEDEERDADSCHCDAEVLKVVLRGHIRHAEDRGYKG